MGLRRGVATLVVFGVLAVALFLVFGAALFAVAILAPVGGAGFLAMKARAARALWQSHGRFDLGGDAVRLIGANRARALGLSELGQGVGGLALSLVPTFLVFGPRTLAIPSLAAGLVTVAVAGISRRRLASGARPVDILPPE